MISNNRPDGYPDDPAFDKAVKETLDKRKADLDQTEKFLKALDDALRKSKD